MHEKRDMLRIWHKITSGVGYLLADLVFRIRAFKKKSQGQAWWKKDEPAFNNGLTGGNYSSVSWKEVIVSWGHPRSAIMGDLLLFDRGMLGINRTKVL